MKATYTIPLVGIAVIGVALLVRRSLQNRDDHKAMVDAAIATYTGPLQTSITPTGNKRSLPS